MHAKDEQKVYWVTGFLQQSSCTDMYVPFTHFVILACIPFTLFFLGFEETSSRKY